MSSNANPTPTTFDEINLRVTHLVVSMIGVLAPICYIDRFHGPEGMKPSILAELFIAFLMWMLSFGLILACTADNGEAKPGTKKTEAPWLLDNVLAVIGLGAIGGLLLAGWAGQGNLIGATPWELTRYLGTGALFGALAYTPIAIVNRTITFVYDRCGGKRSKIDVQALITVLAFGLALGTASAHAAVYAQPQLGDVSASDSDKYPAINVDGYAKVAEQIQVEQVKLQQEPASIAHDKARSNTPGMSNWLKFLLVALCCAAFQPAVRFFFGGPRRRKSPVQSPCCRESSSTVDALAAAVSETHARRNT